MKQIPVILPSNIGGATTQEVGYIEAEAEAVAKWLRGHGQGSTVRRPDWRNVADVVTALSPRVRDFRTAVIPVGPWVAILNDRIRGTDVGVIPSLAARELGCQALRAVCIDDDAIYPARIFELYGPTGRLPLLSIRSIVAANDGGRWVFETAGEALPFERVEHYSKRRKRDRFTCELLREYLASLGVPIGLEPDWGRALLVDQP